MFVAFQFPWFQCLSMKWEPRKTPSAPSVRTKAKPRAIVCDEILLFELVNSFREFFRWRPSRDGADEVWWNSGNVYTALTSSTLSDVSYVWCFLLMFHYLIRYNLSNRALATKFRPWWDLRSHCRSKRSCSESEWLEWVICKSTITSRDRQTWRQSAVTRIKHWQCGWSARILSWRRPRL